MSNFKIFVVSHKKIFCKLEKNYIPIQVGKNNEKLDLTYLRDNTGDNISIKNENYCELTALYWLWKNYELPEYIGICHYRRFFVNLPFYNLVNEKYVDKYLKQYDIILPNKFTTKSNVWNHFIESTDGIEKDLIRLKKLIKEKYPEYYNDFIDIMYGKKASYCNMMILKKDLYNEYCKWLFEILFEYEKTTDLTGYTTEQARIYGYISEFLLNVWVKNKKLKVKYCSVLLVTNNKFVNFLKKIKLLFKDMKRLIIDDNA